MMIFWVEIFLGENVLGESFLSPSSPILGHNQKHGLARSCFILKNFTQNIFTQKIITQNFFYIILKYSIIRISFVYMRWAQLYVSLVLSANTIVIHVFKAYMYWFHSPWHLLVVQLKSYMIDLLVRAWEVDWTLCRDSWTWYIANNVWGAVGKAPIKC